MLNQEKIVIIIIECVLQYHTAILGLRKQRNISVHVSAQRTPLHKHYILIVFKKSDEVIQWLPRHLANGLYHTLHSVLETHVY